MKYLERDSNTMTIAAYYELHMLNKFNYNPPYQRKSVWGYEQKSFLIDTIFKNFPMPPIFLHRSINEKTGSETYHVIDGKQRLTSIIEFINDEVKLPDDFGDGTFGDGMLNGLKFSKIPTEYKKIFWKYKIAIEYVESEDEKIIDSVFDRLNRNGIKLNAQELRRSKYNNTTLYKVILQLKERVYWNNLLKNSVNSDRLEDEEFLSDILFYMLTREIITSNKSTLDKLYEEYTQLFENMVESDLHSIIAEFDAMTCLMRDLNVDFDKYKIYGVSHLYTLWNLIIDCYDKETNLQSIDINSFYENLRASDYEDEFVSLYSEGMARDVKSKSRRKKRLEGLISYLEVR